MSDVSDVTCFWDPPAGQDQLRQSLVVAADPLEPLEVLAILTIQMTAILFQASTAPTSSAPRS